MLRIDKYSLLGWCNGGCTALIVASKAAGRVEKVVVWGGNAYVTEKEVEFYRKLRQNYGKSPETVADRESVKMHGKKYFLDTWSACVDSFRAILDDNGGNICREALPKVKAPTLVLHGALDANVPVEHAVYLHENIENSL